MSNRLGFTLIELMVALAIIGILAAMVIPNFQRMQPGYERDQFIARLNGLVQFSWQNAIVTHSIHKVAFDMGERRAWIERATDERDREGEPVFKPITGQYMDTSMIWSKQIEVKQFIIEGFDEMARFAGRKTAKVWFFLVPEGLSQEVTINLIDTYDTLAGKPRQVGLVLNPFDRTLHPMRMQLC